MPVAHDHVDPALLALTRQDVPALDVPDVVNARRLLQELVRFLHDGVALLVLLAHVQQAHAGPRLVQYVAHVHRPEVGEPDQLARIAVHVGAAIEHQDGMYGGGKQRADRGALHAFVMAAEMNASLAPCFWRPIPTATDERGLLLTAASGFSPMPTTSGASTISRRSRSTAPCGLSAASMSRVRPMSWIRKVGGNSRSACTAT